MARLVVILGSAKACSSCSRRSSIVANTSLARYQPPCDTKSYISDFFSYCDTPRTSILPRVGSTLTIRLQAGIQDTAAGRGVGAESIDEVMGY